MSESLISGVDFVHVGTQDFDRAVEFYGTVLGLPESARYGRMPGAEFETGTLTLAVIQSDAFGLEFRPNPNAIALRVDDVAAARAELEARGVEFRARHHRQRRVPHGPVRGPGRQRPDAPPPIRAARGLTQAAALKCRVSQDLSCGSGGAPTTRSTSVPLRRKSRVGMPCTP